MIVLPFSLRSSVVSLWGASGGGSTGSESVRESVEVIDSVEELDYVEELDPAEKVGYTVPDKTVSRNGI